MIRSICVYSGSRCGARPEYRAAAEELAGLMANRGIRLVYGGGDIGLMGAMADRILAVGGEVIGVIPRCLVEKEVAHHGVTKLHVVETMHERKALMADLSDAFIAIPGGFGTLEELFEVVTWRQLRIHAKPCGLLNTAGYFDDLLRFLHRAADDDFIRRDHLSNLMVCASSIELVERIMASPAAVTLAQPDVR